MENFDFATVWEVVASTVPDSLALIHGEHTWSWRDFENDAARLAGALQKLGVSEGTRVAICMENCPQFIIAQFAAFKLRAVPININYRYTAPEVAYVCENADVVCVICSDTYTNRFLPLLDSSSGLNVVIEFATKSGGCSSTGAIQWDDALAAEPLPGIPRAETDSYILYTGGTTGMPKGVVSHIGDVSRGLLTIGCMARDLTVPETHDQLRALVLSLATSKEAPISIACPPLIHGTGIWLGVCTALALGGTAVTLTRSSYDPNHVLEQIQLTHATDLAIVGDAFARPLLDTLRKMTLEEAETVLSSLRFVHSSGAMWSAEVKDGLLLYGDLTLIDYLGATEGGMGRMVSNRQSSAQTAQFELYPHVRVLGDDGDWIEPGSGQSGMVAISGSIPQEYHDSPEKTASTFRTIDGVRYSIPGDFVRLELDGSTTLLGRGTGCINTGGEKVFPEEVEEAIKRVPGVLDCLVLGVPDPLFGQRVAAVISTREGSMLDTADVLSNLRELLAGYKIPRRLMMVDRVERKDNGKADYEWARGIVGE